MECFYCEVHLDCNRERETSVTFFVCFCHFLELSLAVSEQLHLFSAGDDYEEGKDEKQASCLHYYRIYYCFKIKM